MSSLAFPVGAVPKGSKIHIYASDDDLVCCAEQIHKIQLIAVSGSSWWTESIDTCFITTQGYLSCQYSGSRGPISGSCPYFDLKAEAHWVESSSLFTVKLSFSSAVDYVAYEARFFY